MKAAYIETTGGPEVIRYGDLPTPQPKTGEVRVKVAAAALNPVDTNIRGGRTPMPLPTPFIPGCDLSGTVEAVGPGVTRFKVGDRVWGSNQGLLGRQGTFAEFCCVHEQWLYPLPNGVKEADAAALALVGITAHLGLFWRTNLKRGETVFVNGGAGGVGLCVVQMAKAVGATVIATVGSAVKGQLVTDLGADVVLNYKSDDIPARVKEHTDGRGVDVYYETVPPTELDTAVELTAKRGRVVVMAGRQSRPPIPTGQFYVKSQSLFGFVMFDATPDEQRACANDMNTWMASGALRAVIGKTFPLGEAAAAHQLQEENTLGRKGTLIGKIVIVPAQPGGVGQHSAVGVGDSDGREQEVQRGCVVLLLPCSLALLSARFPDTHRAPSPVT